jgi:ribosomal protein L7/L12
LPFKIVRSLTGLGLKEAKELVESAPKQVQEGVAKTQQKMLRSKLKQQVVKHLLFNLSLFTIFP